MDGMLDYPMTSTLRKVFGKAASMKLLEAQTRENRWGLENGSIALLGTFIDSHVMPRFLSVQPNQLLLQGALAWTFLSEGIPIMYYGTEQEFSGDFDPANREPLWYTGFNSRALLYLFVKRLQEIRREYRVWEHEQVQVHAEEGMYIFARGFVVVAMSNSIGPVEFDGVLGGPHMERSRLCNVLAEKPSSDCFAVPDSGHKVKLLLREYSTKVYAPLPVSPGYVT